MGKAATARDVVPGALVGGLALSFALTYQGAAVALLRQLSGIPARLAAMFASAAWATRGVAIGLDRHQLRALDSFVLAGLPAVLAGDAPPPPAVITLTGVQVAAMPTALADRLALPPHRCGVLHGRIVAEAESLTASLTMVMRTMARASLTGSEQMPNRRDLSRRAGGGVHRACLRMHAKSRSAQCP